MILLRKQLFLFFLMAIISQFAEANNNSNCLCWKVVGWQQNQTQVIRGNIPILQATKCHESHADRVWIQVTMGNNTTNSYWLSLSKQDAFISLYTHPLTGQQSYKFKPFLVLNTPSTNTTPPQILVDTLPCNGCPNHIMAQTTCPCPDPRFGCFSTVINQKPLGVNPTIIGNPMPINPPIPPSKYKGDVLDF